MTLQKLGLAVALSTMVAGVAHAGPIMPDLSLAPAGWTTDRYEPTTFGAVATYEGRNGVLEIGITSAGDLANRPPAYQSTFYNTQGRQTAVSGGAGDFLAADLFIEEIWRDQANGTVRSDMWGVMTDGSAVSGYPIIGFTNYGGTPRYRVYDGNTVAGWVDVATPVDFGKWVSFAITFTGTSFDYSINGALVYSDTTINGTTGFSAVIMQAYNFADASLGQLPLADYEAHWSNAQVPEPTTLGLLGLALVAVARRARKA